MKLKKYLIHWFPECSGGLCDRILGITGNLCIARYLNMELLIKWDINDLGENFRINDKYNYYSYKDISIDESILLNNFDLIEYIKNKNIIKEWENKNILIWSNLNLYNYFIENKYINLYNNYIDDFSNCLKNVLHNYFHINPFIYNQILKINNIYDIGIHIRTNDKHFYKRDRENENIEYINNIFKIISSNYNLDLKKIFISSDCQITYDIAKKYFNNIFYNNGLIIHTAIINSNDNIITNDGIYKVLLDLLTLCNCNKLFIGWNSNFSRIASLYNTNRDIICYEYPNSNSPLPISNNILFKYHSYGKY